MSTTSTRIEVKGIGLVTGFESEVFIEQAEEGHGIVFDLGARNHIQASLERIVNTDRGVTLATANGYTLSIVEHFLSACAMANQMNLKVRVVPSEQMFLPELPLLDGSANDWLQLFKKEFGVEPKIEPDLELPEPVYYAHNDDVYVMALPAETFKVTYGVHFEGSELHKRWAKWDCTKDDIDLIARAQTFGYLRDLPILQSQGLAKGVTQDNTLGITDDGGYTRDLRFEDEPIYHKMLDLIGDMTLTGINPTRIKAHFIAFNAGHGSHTKFAKRLQEVMNKK